MIKHRSALLPSLVILEMVWLHVSQGWMFFIFGGLFFKVQRNIDALIEDFIKLLTAIYLFYIRHFVVFLYLCTFVLINIFKT